MDSQSEHVSRSMWRCRTACCCLALGVTALFALLAHGLIARGRRATTEAKMRVVAVACRSYRMDVGALPREISDLWRAPLGSRRWCGPYLARSDAIDYWGREFGYVSDDDLGFRLVSLGSDGRAGGSGAAADLTHTHVFD